MDLQKRIVALDVGDVRIGIAVSDPFGILAVGLTTLNRTSKWEDVKVIREIIAEYSADTVVVGLPKNMNNTVGPQGKKVMKFVNALVHNYPINVVYIDERMTTISAERILIEGNVSRKNRKNVVDKVAATYILQSFLDAQQKGE